MVKLKTKSVEIEDDKIEKMDVEQNKKERKRKAKQSKENEDSDFPKKKSKMANGISEENGTILSPPSKKSKKKVKTNDKTGVSNGTPKKVKKNNDLETPTKKHKKTKKDKSPEKKDADSDDAIIVKKAKKIKTPKKNDGNEKVTKSDLAEKNTIENKEEDETLDDKEQTLEQLGAFSNFNINQSIVDKLKARKVTYLFPVQAKSFESVFSGKDVVAQARTGTGKTFAFAIPIIEILQSQTKDEKYGRGPKVLVMAPTRELARQVCDDFESISNSDLSILCVYGGTPYGPQEQKFRKGVDIVVGTPGRIYDFAEKGTLRLDGLKHMVLDEVDRMLDMGFSDMVDKILQFAYQIDKPDENPQTLLFSATLPRWVHTTAKKYMKDNVVSLDLVGTEKVRTSTTVKHLAIKCGYMDRAATVGSILSVYSGNHGRAMVFCETKRDADELTVSTEIKQETHVLHGDIPQDKREMVLKSFREGRYKCLITTDVAARGLDIPEVDLVIQCSPPQDTDSYIHRAGRTGRAGRAGVCVLFYKPREENNVGWVEQKAGIKFKRIGAPSANDLIEAAANDVIRSLDSIPEATLDYFKQSAENLIEQKGAVISLAAALAVISGNTEFKARSLLNSLEGFTTYLFKTTVAMNTKSYAWGSLNRHIPQEVSDKIRGMRMLADRSGVVFDLPSDLDSVVTDRWSDGKFDTLVVATELPEIEPEVTTPGRFGGGGGFGGGGRRGFGGRFGGRGGGRWGGGGGGRGFGGGFRGGNRFGRR